MRTKPEINTIHLFVRRYVVMTRRVWLPLAMSLALAACHGSKEKRYQFDGTIMALDPAAKTATIRAGQIGDWMDPMTMEYRIKPDSEFAKLHVGDAIHATAVVQDPSYYVTAINVKAR
jgi:Cu/Ag efflux protein CusF